MQNNSMTGKYSFALFGMLLAFAGCENKDVAQAPPPPVHNAATEYVESRVTAMNKAQSVADKANAVNQQQASQAQSGGE
jgi:hypothetical protein